MSTQTVSARTMSVRTVPADRSSSVINDANLRALYECVGDDVRRYATRRLQPADAEDVIGNVWVAVVRRSQRDDETVLSPAWVMAVTRNKVVDVWRRRARDRRLEERMWASLSSTFAPDPADLLTQASAEHLLGRLSTTAAMVLRLKYIYCLPVREIAGALGISERAVESRLARARRQLAFELGAEKTAIQAWRSSSPSKSPASSH